jgi:hypothetical protein
MDDFLAFRFLSPSPESYTALTLDGSRWSLHHVPAAPYFRYRSNHSTAAETARSRAVV